MIYLVRMTKPADLSYQNRSYKDEQKSLCHWRMRATKKTWLPQNSPWMVWGAVCNIYTFDKSNFVETEFKDVTLDEWLRHV